MKKLLGTLFGVAVFLSFFCNQRMEPVYDNKHTPDFWQECPACGYVHDMRCHDEQEGGENDE